MQDVLRDAHVHSRLAANVTRELRFVRMPKPTNPERRKKSTTFVHVTKSWSCVVPFQQDPTRRTRTSTGVGIKRRPFDDDVLGAAPVRRVFIV